MNSEVLISIHPKHCENILNGSKTIEVRKTLPKIKPPFKGYIYCTGVKTMNLNDYVKLHRSTGGKIDEWQGKVIGEFACDNIDEVKDYGNGKTLYGWHISELKIYDEPKELTDYAVFCKHYLACEKIYCDKDSCHHGYIPLNRPPQSWQYVIKNETIRRSKKNEDIQ